MNLQSDNELENTRKKLQLLQDHYQSRLHDGTPDTHVKQLSLRSIKKIMNQLTEEIARYEAHVIKR